MALIKVKISSQWNSLLGNLLSSGTEEAGQVSSPLEWGLVGSSPPSKGFPPTYTPDPRHCGVEFCAGVQVRRGECTGEPQTEKCHLEPLPPPLVRKNQWGDRQPLSEHAGGQGRRWLGLQPHCG